MRSALLWAVASAAAASVVSATVLRNRENILPALSPDAFHPMPMMTIEDVIAGNDLREFNIDPNALPTSSVTDLISDGAAMEPSEAEVLCRNNPEVRVEWRNYPTEHRVALMNAIYCLMELRSNDTAFAPSNSRYEDFVRLHQMWTPNFHSKSATDNQPAIHNAKFIIWHRFYLHVWLQVMRADCGFTAPLPWWDATKDAGNFAGSDMFSPQYFGSLLPPAVDGSGQCITDGAFVSKVNLHIGPGDTFTPHCMNRGVNEEVSAQCTAEMVTRCLERTSFQAMALCIERGPHGLAHNAIGGVMSDVDASVSDPFFWMVHLFVDHSFWQWQQADPSRLYAVDGLNAQGQALTLDTFVSVAGIRSDATVRDVINPFGGVVLNGVPFCYTYDY